ncbi:unnamed protein product [Dicrocoelium dendriticum]|nr:unnamed protein product [Dicrocoelium dendriticum]
MHDSVALNGGTQEEKSQKFIHTIDPDDPEYQQNLMRPASIKEDVCLMHQKQRVSLVLKSDAFRRELEEIVRSQSRSAEYPGLNTSLLSLQHVSDIFSSVPAGQLTTDVGLSKGQPNGIIPINDLRGIDATFYSRRERALRCKLASVYRLIDLFGWNTSIHNHVTARISSRNEHFLINPFGLLYHEITASSLIKVDAKGHVLDPGSTVLGLSTSTWMLHSAVHLARADIRCIVHVDTPATVAVSCMKSGLLPLCQEAMILGDIAYYAPPNSVTLINGDRPPAVDHDRLKDWTQERTVLVEALGPTARVLFLWSRGLLALGETIEEAWHYATNSVVACDTQEALSSPTGARRARTLDGKGCISQDDGIRIPPTASSLTATMAFFHDDGVLSGEETDTHRPLSCGREYRQKSWLNTPNKYVKELIRPSPDHQPVSHWISEREDNIRKAILNGALPPPAPFHPLTPAAISLGSTGGRPTGTSAYSSFTLPGSNPREYRDQQRKVKAKYYRDTNTAGPQSRLLDGLTWDEARRVRDEGLTRVLGSKAAALVTRGVTSVPVAAASKAIIQRDVRDVAVIYDALYSHQNPFESITDEELELYRREVELKNNPYLSAEFERRGLALADTGPLHSPTTADSLAVDSGATDLESASDTGPTHLSLPAATSTLTSEPSGTDDLGEPGEQRKKSKKRFMLFSLSRSKRKGKKSSS